MSLFTVFGSGGFIGSNLVERLQRMEHELYLPKRDDLGMLSRSLGHAIYAIGLTSDFRDKPIETVEAHVCVLKKILAECDFESFTYLSSTRVYIGLSDTCENVKLMVGSDNLCDLYNLSKLMGESLCLNCGHSNMKVIRLSNIVGKRQDADTFLDQLLSEGVKNEEIIFQTSLDSKKDYLCIDDAVGAIIDIALSGENGIFNLASGKGVTNLEIANIIKQISNINVIVEKNAPIWSFAPINILKIKNKFDFNPIDFEKYFPDFIESYLRKKKSN